MPHDHDALFRQTFGDPAHAAPLLRELLPEALARAIDWATLALVPGSFVDESLRNRHADLLFSARAAGHSVLLYVLLEHKSTGDRFTALQLLRYVLRVHDRHRRDHADASHLPPVVPVVVHHGPRAFVAPRTVLELIALEAFPPAVQKVLSPLQCNLHFLLDDLAKVPESRLRARRTTPQGTLTLLLLQFVRDAREGDPVAFAERWLPLWRAMWAEPAGRLGLLSLFSYLTAHLEAPRERFVEATVRIRNEDETMGKTIAQQWIEEGIEQGLEQGLEKGKAEGRAEMLLRQIGVRFGRASPQVEQTVREADIASLDRWAERILTARTTEELFA